MRRFAKMMRGQRTVAFKTILELFCIEKFNLAPERNWFKYEVDNQYLVSLTYAIEAAIGEWRSFVLVIVFLYSLFSCCSWHCSWRPASGFWWWGGRGELGTGGRSWDQWGLDYHQGVEYLQGDYLDYHQVSTLHLDHLDKLDPLDKYLTNSYLTNIWQTPIWLIDKPQWTQIFKLRNSTLHSDWPQGVHVHHLQYPQGVHLEYPQCAQSPS